MLLKLNISNKHLKRFLEHSFYLFLVFILIPVFFYFELCIVLPAIIEEWSIPYFVHLIVAHFSLLNIIGNLIFGMFTNTTIRGRMLNTKEHPEWPFCSICECYQPPRAWHCNICDTCILKRDHHCTFFACCVGYYNHRYFILFTFYIFVSMIYAFYYNVQFVSKFLTWSHGLVLLKFLFPLLGIVIDFGIEALYVFLIVVNVAIAAFTGFLFIYHFKNIMQGKIVYEKNSNKKSAYDLGWRRNIEEVFGHRWYLTWILPFIHSPLPGDGFTWPDEFKEN